MRVEAPKRQGKSTSRRRSRHEGRRSESAKDILDTQCYKQLKCLLTEITDTIHYHPAESRRKSLPNSLFISKRPECLGIGSEQLQFIPLD